MSVVETSLLTTASSLEFEATWDSVPGLMVVTRMMPRITANRVVSI